MTHPPVPANTGIPLHCNICPKKPFFSDTSHLLTHIASKQHLSNYFKLKVRVSQDPVAQRDVDDYDRWYEEWNLDDLMRERMSQKERRSRGNNGSVRRTNGAAAPRAPSSSRSGSVPVSMSVPRREVSLRNNLLDPQLGPKIKREPNSRPSTPGLLPPYDIMDGARGFVPMVNGWHSMPYGPSPSHVATSTSYASDADDDDDDSTSSYGYSQPRMTRRRKLSDENTSWPGSMAGSMHGSVYLGEEQDAFDAPNDMARLKGDIWPGMDIFDSATPEMRRKRNQKKATSVIVQLQATSEIVTPTELIFDHAGEFKKERIISGEPNSADSPLRGETTPEPDEPPVKKRATTRRRPKTALAERDPNGGRNLRSNRRNGAHHPSFGKTRSHYVDGSDDLDDDDGLTYRQSRPQQRRSGLSIHRDNTGPDITFDRPASMTYLTASFEPFPSTQVDSKSTQSGYGRPINPLRDGGYYAPPPQSYRSQPKPPSAGYTQPHAGRDLSAFGAFTNQPLFPTANDVSTSLVGSAGFQGIQSQYPSAAQMAPVTQSFVNDNTMQMHNWDVFGLNNDASFGSLDINFGNANDTNGANPLFFDGTTALPGDDDEGTVSAPLSDHGVQSG